MPKIISAECPACGAPVKPQQNWFFCPSCRKHLRLEEDPDGRQFMAIGIMVEGRIHRAGRELICTVHEEGELIRLEMLRQENKALSYQNRASDVELLKHLHDNEEKLAVELKELREKKEPGSRTLSQIEEIESELANLTNQIHVVETRLGLPVLMKSPTKKTASSSTLEMILGVMGLVIIILFLILVSHCSRGQSPVLMVPTLPFY